MKRILCFGLIAGLLFSVLATNGQESVAPQIYKTWGRLVGSSSNNEDFLIYDAHIPSFDSSIIYVVGRSRNEYAFELKQGEGTFFQKKNVYTDAFLSCFSITGELLWSTYLPSEGEKFINGMATCVRSISDSSFIVVCNDYNYSRAIGLPIEDFRNRIPLAEGQLNLFEFHKSGRLLKTQSYLCLKETRISPTSLHAEPLPYMPIIFHIKTDPITGFFPEGHTVFSSQGRFCFSPYGSLVSFPFDPIIFELDNPDTVSLPNHAYWIGPSLFLLLQYKTDGTFYIGYRASGELTNHSHKSDSSSTFQVELSSKESDEWGYPLITEKWNVSALDLPSGSGSLSFSMYPWQNISTGGARLLAGSTQNILPFGNFYLVQGIHSKNYNNGFASGSYSHPEVNVPSTGNSVFPEKRPDDFVHVPYLCLYPTSLFDIPIPTVPDSTAQATDTVVPSWFSFLPSDWLYEDFFHRTNIDANLKDYFMPYVPIMLSSGNKVFLIGNMKAIDDEWVDNPPMTEEVRHHHGVILAFNVNFSGCPPERTAFENVPFLCPGDSVELRMPTEYTGFTLRFDPSVADNASVILNPDSSRAWVRQEGIYRAVLDGSAIGCPDASVDSVRISLSPYPEPVGALPEDTTVSCAAFRPLFQAVAQHDSTFSYRWYDGDTIWQKPCGFIGDSLQPVSVTVNGYCTSFSDTAFIRFLPPYVALGNDTLICHTGMPADTALLLHLDANQDYFPAANWIFRWLVNGHEAGRGDSLLLRFADLDSMAPSHYQAIASVFVSLSDTATDGCTASDTISLELFVLPNTEGNVFLPKDSILCAHLDLDLRLPGEADNFHCFWLDRDSITLPFGEDTNRFVVQGLRGTDGFGAGTDSRNPRFFQLRLDHKICGVSLFDTLLVYDQIKPAFELPFHDTVICLNEPVALDSLSPFVYRPFYAFEWNDGTAGSGHSFADSGTYILRFFVRDSFAICDYDDASDTVNVLWSDPAMTLISIPEDTSFCERLSVTLDASVPSPATRYSWQEGNLDDLVPPTEDSTLFTSPVLKVDRETSYGLFLLDTLGCLNTKQINIHEEDCKPKLEIPNVFTPNGDGVNDVWRFTQLEKCYNVDILVVDRKGSHVLHEKVGNADDFSWNGCYRNGSRKMPDGPYFYMVSYKDAYGKKKVQSGSVTILGTAE